MTYTCICACVYVIGAIPLHHVGSFIDLICLFLCILSSTAMMNFAYT